MSRKSYEVDSQLGEAKRRIDRLVSLVGALESNVQQQNARMQTLENILIKSGILVEIKDTPPVVADLTIQRKVPNPSPFALITSCLYIQSTKNYKVVIPNQQKDATGEPKKKGGNK